MPGELEPALPPPDLQGVPAQMSRIFAAAGASDSAMGPAYPAQVSALRPGRGGVRPMTLLVAAVAGLAGLGAGAFVIHSPSPAPAPAPAAQPQVAETPALQAEAVPAASAPPMRLALAPPVTTPPVTTPPEAAPLPEPGPLAEAKPPPVRPAPRAQAPVRARAVRHAAAPRPRLTRAKALRRREPQPLAQPASCEKNAVAPGCRQAVVQADRHLRNVYETAIRRGVPRAVLIDYRDRWADLRESDSDDPARLIERYGALAYDLGREAKDDREGEARRRNPSGLHALASALAPWW